MKQRLNLITLGVADLERARRFYEALGWPRTAASRTRRAGVESREPGETFWGGYSGVFIDPDGHPWEVAHNPHWTITEDGGLRLGSGS